MKSITKTILTAVIIILIVVFGILAWKGFKTIKGLQDDNLILGISNSKLQKAVEMLEQERSQAWSKVDSLHLVSHDLRIDLENTYIKLQKLRDSLNTTVVVIDELPDDKSYEYLQIRYEDSEEKEFGFSGEQVNEMHRDIVVGDILEGINLELVEANSILEEQVMTKEKIENGLLDVIESYKSENNILYKANSELQKNNIRIRTQRNIITVVSIAEAVGIALLILL